MHATAPTFTVSLPCFAAMSQQGGVEAFDQSRCGEGLGQETNCPGVQRPGADALIGKGRDENERRTVALGAHERQQVQAAQDWHLHIRNHTGGVMQLGRPQELLGGRKCIDLVPMRPQKIVSRRAHRCIIVNDGYDRKC